MEEVRRHGRLSHLKIDVLGIQAVVRRVGVVRRAVNHLQEPLEVARGVVGAGPIESVRQEKHNARLAKPLSLRAHEVLVEN